MRRQIVCGNYLELELPTCAIADICTSGPNDEAVNYWWKHVDFPPRDKILLELEGYGFDDLEADTDFELQQKLLWVMAWNQFDEERDQ